MTRVNDESAAANSSSQVEEESSTTTTTTKHVRLAGNNGLPGGEQQQGTSTEVAIVPSETGSPGGGRTQLALPSSSSIATSSSHQFSLPLDENDHRYVGLVNQAMTCYLNSLVQSLYMTPEFRNAMYEWEYIQQPNSIRDQKKKAESSIPCQLQKLFLLLQTSENDSLETKDLTQSFGWTSNEAYDQHDVQELCRLMFDALEHKWKGTKHEKLIQDLYRGSMEDVVSCLKCGYESVKKDYFLDLPLAVKPFTSMHAYKSVEEALTAFVQPELLDGSNQYMCESCKSKQDAHKGLRITQFPYLLTIQLKRFDFDYNTMHRIKLNDKMTFPDVLDLNEYVIKKEKPAEAEPEQPKSAWKTIPKKEEVEEEEEDDLELGSPNPKRYTPGNQSPNRYDANGEEILVGQPINHEVVDRMIKKNGENVYELFSVMVHSGNAAGGHYFAYIKNLDQDKWYVFNDTRVDFATPLDIEKSFGGHPMGWNQSNTNAYMLMYRKIDRKRNASFILTNKLPRHIKNSQEKWKRMEQEAEEERLRRMNLLQVHVTINYPFPSYVKLPDKTIKDLTSQKEQIAADFALYRTEISREQPIEAIFNQSYAYFSEQFKAYNLPHSKSSARLIYSEHNHMVMDYKSPAEMKKKIRSVFNPNLSEPGPMYVVNFVLDVRISSCFFNLDVQNKVTIRVQRVDVGKRTTANELTMVLPGDVQLLRVKQWIGSQFRDDIHALCGARMVLETASNPAQFMIIGADFNAWEFRTLVSRYVGNAIPTFYYDGGIQTMVTKESAEATEEDRKIQDFQKTVMYNILDRKCFSTVVKVRLPSEEDVKKATVSANAYQGPSWAETEANMKKEDKTWNQPRVSSTTAEISSIVSKNETQDVNNLVAEGDDEPIPSGRVSTASMRSASLDDMDEGIPGSLCNNTPQMSPCVSEGDDLDDTQTLEGKSQIMADYMQKTGPDFYRGDPSLLYNAKEESLSAVSSGQSTLVPSTSNQAISRPSPSDESGKIHVISSSENYHRLDIDSRMAVGEFKKVRFREIHQGTLKTGRAVLNPNDKFTVRSYWNAPLNLQIIEESLIGKPGEAMLVRRFRPSTVEVSPVHEVLIDGDAECPAKEFIEAISKHSGIPVERVAVMEPENFGWTKWPYVKSRLDMLESK
ncbi:hypothetical protein CAEBREN_00248 [Caenorhabditis brenneri]|uniref:USP domain-containing protein n=1 Tax=Caenorhabditis brenneri TaxID=135651 RepID=G0NW71_CAEBE|nr:hypothetical protein CAEBREN_00248 [Caenorhabditis brenneri]